MPFPPDEKSWNAMLDIMDGLLTDVLTKAIDDDIINANQASQIFVLANPSRLGRVNPFV